MIAKNRISLLSELKAAQQRIVMVTAYDYPTGLIADRSGVDVVLVGDSLGNAILGFENTIPVRLEHMIHHSLAVSRGVTRALLVADMPFMTYKITSEEALRSAARLVQEARVEAVKLEGGTEICETVKRIVQAGIPVMGHLGLTPQSVHALGGYKVQGRDPDRAQQLLDDALALEQAGCFGIVLECLPVELAQKITKALSVSTIGIGSGLECDGQVLVLSDLIGLTFGKVPRFVKQYGDLGQAMQNAVEEFATEVRSGIFPDDSQTYH